MPVQYVFGGGLHEQPCGLVQCSTAVLQQRYLPSPRTGKNIVRKLSLQQTDKSILSNQSTAVYHTSKQHHSVQFFPPSLPPFLSSSLPFFPSSSLSFFPSSSPFHLPPPVPHKQNKINDTVPTHSFITFTLNHSNRVSRFRDLRPFAFGLPSLPFFLFFSRVLGSFVPAFYSVRRNAAGQGKTRRVRCCDFITCEPHMLT
ncbi:hypothetical protein L873DRAFT_481295 [Choiromyces venosus 120613-1]|uniref:Uncharacterized protein n=1 Tax=Choiromyces venosus 120613-1 TaxID=1336337 RepID=A0A3N4JV23_9PEZI|nr:hypothetical protein L873DRAFT_481295 [Choiromyces venosus 120613-1]